MLIEGAFRPASGDALVAENEIADRNVPAEVLSLLRSSSQCSDSKARCQDGDFIAVDPGCDESWVAAPSRLDIRDTAISGSWDRAFGEVVLKAVPTARCRIWNYATHNASSRARRSSEPQIRPFFPPGDVGK